jgi:hypothetical protein
MLLMEGMGGEEQEGEMPQESHITTGSNDGS